MSKQFVFKLNRKIKYHRFMMEKYKRFPDKREYHERWVAACQKELKEYVEEHYAGVFRP